jgi:hypothetical protein
MGVKEEAQYSIIPAEKQSIEAKNDNKVNSL